MPHQARKARQRDENVHQDCSFSLFEKPCRLTPGNRSDAAKIAGEKAQACQFVKIGVNRAVKRQIIS